MDPATAAGATEYLQYGALGLLALVLVGLGTGTVWSVSWLAKNFLAPIKDAHLAYLHETKESLEHLKELPAQTEMIRDIHGEVMKRSEPDRASNAA